MQPVFDSKHSGFWDSSAVPSTLPLGHQFVLANFVLSAKKILALVGHKHRNVVQSGLLFVPSLEEEKTLCSR